MFVFFFMVCSFRFRSADSESPVTLRTWIAPGVPLSVEQTDTARSLCGSRAPRTNLFATISLFLWHFVAVESTPPHLFTAPLHELRRFILRTISLASPSSTAFFAVRLNHRMDHRIVRRMKVTALVPDALIKEVRTRAGARTTTECVIVALEEWVAARRLAELIGELEKRPLKFQARFSSDSVRSQSRRRASDRR